MYPFIHIGSWSLGTFGLFVWLAAVLAGVLLHFAFTRDGVDADAMNVVVYVLIAGVLGSKLWHELQSPAELAATMHRIFAPGTAHTGQVVSGLLEWLRSGFAWFGGLLAGITMLLWQGSQAKPNGLTGLRGGIRMMDLAAPAAAVGYGIGRIGCLTSGDGDYGKVTTSWIGVHLSPDALVPAIPANAAVLPTPLFECAIALMFAFLLWKLGERARPLGWLTGLYLFLSGTARFMIEFWRINPPLYFGKTMSNAQVAAMVSALVGLTVLAVVWNRERVGGRAIAAHRGAAVSSAS
jgi:phosphatidylglycerol:prolipoprotein diacylglycerol transferase